MTTPVLPTTLVGSYSNRFANSLSGVDLDDPGTAIDRTGLRLQIPVEGSSFGKLRSMVQGRDLVRAELA
jgi:hypothetical protein